MAAPTSIARNASLVGWLSGDDLLVEGRLEGNLTASGRVHLAATSTVRASVDAAVTQIDGEFEGELRTRILRIGPSGRARGRFRFESLVVADGAVIEGAFNEEPVAGADAVTTSAAAAAELTAVEPAGGLADHPDAPRSDAAPDAEPQQLTVA
jgi:cytoskeletal protein CcmA (bactofilin family)